MKRAGVGRVVQFPLALTIWHILTDKGQTVGMRTEDDADVVKVDRCVVRGRKGYGLG